MVGAAGAGGVTLLTGKSMAEHAGSALREAGKAWENPGGAVNRARQVAADFGEKVKKNLPDRGPAPFTKEWFKTPAGKARLRAAGKRGLSGAALFGTAKLLHNIGSYESAKALARKPPGPGSR